MDIAAAATKISFVCLVLSSLLLRASAGSSENNNNHSSSFASTAPPWQTNPSPFTSTSSTSRNDNDEDDENYQGIVTRFAPGGRVIAVEQAMRVVTNTDNTAAAAAASSGNWNTAVALVCCDGTVVVSTVPSSPYLYFNETEMGDNTGEINASSSSSSSYASLWLMDPTDRVGVPPTVLAPFLRIPMNTRQYPSLSPVLAVTVGNPVSSQLLRHRVATLVDTTQYDRDGTVGGWARRVADQCQVLTQRSGSSNDDDDEGNASSGTLLPVALLLLDAKSLWRVDPSGQFWKFRAVVLGRHAARVEERLLEKLRQAAGLDGCEGGDNGTENTTTATTSSSAVSNMSVTVIKDWIGNHLTMKEALRIATQCVVEAYEHSNNQPTRDRMAATKTTAATTPRAFTKVNTKLQIRGIAISQGSAPRMRCFAGKELWGMVHEATVGQGKGS